MRYRVPAGDTCVRRVARAEHRQMERRRLRRYVSRAHRHSR
ncbi:MAG: hypothetical protein ACJ8OJ_10620 [Povalibacter sp.]